MNTLELRERAKITTIEERLRTLNERYFMKAIATENPIIDNLIEDHRLFLDSNPNTKPDRKTILCAIIQTTEPTNHPSTIQALEGD